MCLNTTHQYGNPSFAHSHHLLACPLAIEIPSAHQCKGVLYSHLCPHFTPLPIKKFTGGETEDTLMYQHN